MILWDTGYTEAELSFKAELFFGCDAFFWAPFPALFLLYQLMSVSLYWEATKSFINE